MDVKGERVTIQLVNTFSIGMSGDDVAVYGETSSVISDFYTIEGRITFSNLKPGFYMLSVKRGEEFIVSETVEVKSYIKPTYRLTISPDRKAVFAGDTINCKIKAEFFEGTPVASLKLKCTGYSGELISGEVQLDQNGEGLVLIKAGYPDRRYAYGSEYFTLTVYPAVAEEGETSPVRQFWFLARELIYGSNSL